jgi:hypothetical protein
MSLKSYFLTMGWLSSGSWFFSSWILSTRIELEISHVYKARAALS